MTTATTEVLRTYIDTEDLVCDMRDAFDRISMLTLGYALTTDHEVAEALQTSKL